MPTTTYTLIDSQTLSSNAPYVFFSSIPSTFRDLVVTTSIRTGRGATTDICFLRANNDSGNNYPRQGLYGTGSARGAFTGTESGYYMQLNGNTATASLFSFNELHIMDYSATDKHKTAIVRQNEGNNGAVLIEVQRWANNSAITSLSFISVNADFLTGSTFALFGVAA